MAVAAQRPLLVLRGKDVALRGALKEGYVHPVVAVPRKTDADWLKSDEFENAFATWLAAVRAQRHVFLGYSSKAKPMADAISRFLNEKLGLSVLDWHDPPPSGVIIQNIADAERRTMFGVFLFTKDDKRIGKDGRESVPRDNVIYEAGYFAGAKGPGSVLIVREGDARVPTDLGGFTYVNAKSRSDVASIEGQIRDYFASRLSQSGVESLE
jgi:predicted nucleotide-binding protein